MNMVTIEVMDVQQVTMRLKGKAAEWETQEAIHKHAAMWIQQANQRNIDEMQEQAKSPKETTSIANDDPLWQALQQCQIMLPLGRLLQLVPRFTETLKLALSPLNLAMTPTFFTNLGEGPTVVDTNSPAITAIIKGRELPGTIVDGGSGVNVISLQTCDTLGIQEWEPCPFWLQMADTSSIRPTGLIWDLEVTIRISAVVVQLNAPGAYPLLLGSPWITTTHIKHNWQKNMITFRTARPRYMY